MHLRAALSRHALPIRPLLRRNKLKEDLILLFLDNDLHFLETTRVSSCVKAGLFLYARLQNVEARRGRARASWLVLSFCFQLRLRYRQGIG
jgi:hypothetical protein